MGFLSDMGGDLLGGLLDSKSQRRSDNRNIRYQREFAQNSIQWRTDDAIAAGVHPLFAMGANTASFQPGIPESGSAAGNAVRRISGREGNRERLKLENDLIREQIETSRWRRQVDRSNATQDSVSRGITVPGINTSAQEIDKGKVQPFKTKNPEQSTNVMSPMSQFRIGSQKVWLPIEEIDQAMEDPVAVFIAAFNYKGNKNVNWAKVAAEYSGKPMGTALSKRNPAMMKAGAAFKRWLDSLDKGGVTIKPLKRTPRAFAYGDTP